MNKKHTWKVQVFGERVEPKDNNEADLDDEYGAWEITVVRSDNKHGQESWGWYDERKLLVSQSGPDSTPLCKFVWDEMLHVAEELCSRLNAGEKID